MDHINTLQRVPSLHFWGWWAISISLYEFISRWPIHFHAIIMGVRLLVWKVLWKVNWKWKKNAFSKRVGIKHDVQRGKACIWFYFPLYLAQTQHSTFINIRCSLCMWKLVAIMGNNAKLILHSFDLIFNVSKNVIDLCSKKESIKLLNTFWDKSLKSKGFFLVFF